MHIRRRILLAAALIMPTTTLAAVAATSGPASASSVSCTVTANVAFAAPGLSRNGTGSATAKTTSTSVTGSVLTCNTGNGSLGTLTITSKSNKCTGAGTGKSPAVEPACIAKKNPIYVYGSLFDFAGSGPSIQKSLKKLSFSIGTTAYSLKTSSAGEITGTGANTACGAGVVGFDIMGTVKAPKTLKGAPFTTVACLVTDSGPGTSGTFANDLGVPGITITNATIGGLSSLTIG